MREEFSRIGFAKTYVLPVLLILLVPGFSLWFFNSAVSRHDREILESVEKGLNADGKLSGEQRGQLLDLFRKVPISRLLMLEVPELAPIQKNFEKVSGTYAVFRWMIRISWICLITAVAAFALGGISVVLSLRSQVAQYWSLAAGWHVLKLISAMQVAGQGVLAVALSYWVTALWMESYSPKLVLCIALLALFAVWSILCAIFKTLDATFPLKGQILDPARADGLWARLGEMASTLQIAKPDQIVVGIDDNFFVTEHPVTIDGREHPGRTLFISLPLLKILEKDEADAVLAHELAHFSGQDTLYSRKISPILARYGEYLEALHKAPLARPVFYFMLCFRGLFELSLKRTGREREFRADATAVKLTSESSLANALLKTTAYSCYRASVENKLFDQEAVMESARIAAGINEGFPAFIGKGLKLEELGATGTSHPFDSHPPLLQRMEAVGIHLDATHRETVLLTGVQRSWHQEIAGADEIENAQWAAYEEAFRQVHEVSLAYRFRPDGEEQQRVVEKYFPPVCFEGASGARIALDFAQVHHSEWPEPIPLDKIEECKGDESFGKNYLCITHRAPGAGKSVTVKLCTSALPDGGSAFLDGFSNYYGRHLAAKEHRTRPRNGSTEETKA